MPAKLGAVPGLIKTSVSTKVLVLTSAEITATNTVKLKMIKMEFYFGNFFFIILILSGSFLINFLLSLSPYRGSDMEQF